MKTSLIHKQRTSKKGYVYTDLTHVKVMRDDAGFIAFARITPDLLEKIDSVIFDIDERFLVWRGKDRDERELGTQKDSIERRRDL